MKVEQAIFTSLSRGGKSGYHVIARSPGVSEQDANAIAAWSPSNGALIVDPANQISVNYHPLPGGRFVLSRTCEGPPEYSGRGGKQLFTQVLLIEADDLRAAAAGPIAVYRDALALGKMVYRANPPNLLEAVELGTSHLVRDPNFWFERAKALGLPDLKPIVNRLLARESVRIAYPGDRLVLAQCILGALPPDLRFRVSFSTSLRPSAVRPCRLVLVGPEAAK